MGQKIILEHISDIHLIYNLIKHFTNEEKINLLFIYLKRLIKLESNQLTPLF